MERWLNRASTAFEEFVKSQAFGGTLLVLCTIVAMMWANSSHSAAYFDLDRAKIGIYWGHFALSKTVKDWVNDGLMSVFFLLVGLEIKREVLAGELSVISKAVLPVAAAIGGMVFPALIFFGFTHDQHHALAGWGVPMATDIAFSLGILSLMGKRIPRSLIVLLSAIAIVDDLGSVIVIAVFYNHGMSVYYLMLAALIFVLMCLLNRMGVRRLPPYLFLGIILWYALLMSGVHATIAGVLLALVIPGASKYQQDKVASKLADLSQQFSSIKSELILADEERKVILQGLENVVQDVETPLQRLEHRLHIPVTYIIVPLFVLFNAGIDLSKLDFSQAFTNGITLGVLLGLLLGKCIGIFGLTWVLCRFKWVKLPSGVTLLHIFPLSLLAGIGFTMSIFIGELAYPESVEMLRMAKVGILSASVIAAIIGYVMMRWAIYKRPISGTTETLRSI